MTTSTTTSTTLSDILSRRGNRGHGYNDVRLLELIGATIVEPTAFEPDPKTYRGSYYYNAILNQLFKKVIAREEPATGIIIAYWTPVN